MQGISVEGQENIQEILTKQLVLCQYICALSILQTGPWLALKCPFHSTVHVAYLLEFYFTRKSIQALMKALMTQ